jgi:hypothetical protein
MTKRTDHTGRRCPAALLAALSLVVLAASPGRTADEPDLIFKRSTVFKRCQPRRADGGQRSSGPRCTETFLKCGHTSVPRGIHRLNRRTAADFAAFARGTDSESLHWSINQSINIPTFSS